MVGNESSDAGTSIQRSEMSSSSVRVVDDRSGDLLDNTRKAALRRLEEVRIGEEEAQLSEEQISSNDQRQEDEIQIHYDFSDDYTVSTKLCSSNITFKGNSQADTDSAHPDDFLYSFKVQHLPPVVLICLLPESYPSNHAPYFTVYTPWLDALKISIISHMLNDIWLAQAGQEVIYKWVEWLKNSSLAHLGLDNGLMLSAYDMSDNKDMSMLSGNFSLEHVIPWIISYNDEKCTKTFLNSLQLCIICFNEFAGHNFVRLPCKHFFCFKCMETYLNMHVREGNVTKLMCPDTKCGCLVPPTVLQRLLGRETFERWESLLLQKTLASMSDVVYCPRCETGCLEAEENHAQCSKCFFSFCSICRERRHVGLQCMTPELKLKILQERQNLSNIKDTQRKKEQEMVNEILSIREALRDSKQCPSCKIAISRIEGCNKMTCGNCGNFFCYNCGKMIDGYEHFSTGCELFQSDQIMAWEERMNPRQMRDQIRANLFREAAHMCPNCRQKNIKVLCLLSN
ncbi:hypothetical protein HPP92_025674 [Vanilla planifolia]|uniref:RBR-type E3 ubiquitin transferase n=1 Tax=Vanilla planifolia TaxID=51239 RepID=A0A835U9K4_VANPL|nr:hypothetical protein HPP92_025674 [Vanilla planifolia]